MCRAIASEIAFRTTPFIGNRRSPDGNITPENEKLYQENAIKWERQLTNLAIITFIVLVILAISLPIIYWR